MLRLGGVTGVAQSLLISGSLCPRGGSVSLDQCVTVYAGDGIYKVSAESGITNFEKKYAYAG